MRFASLPTISSSRAFRRLTLQIQKLENRIGGATLLNALEYFAYFRGSRYRGRSTLKATRSADD